MSDTAIRVENLGKLYHIGAAQQRHDTLRDALVARFRRNGRPTEDETLWALKDVSFEVKRGEVVGVIGRNGAGKSTLLKILSRITEPSTGHVELHGRVGSLLEVGTGFHPELTGRENVYLNGAILGMKRTEIERKFDEIVAFSEIEKFLDTPVKRYSSGMYVRLAFAVAAHLEPEILLVDEVLAVGDAAFQNKCLGKMGDVASQGRTVLFVSHNMAAVNNLCSRSIVLSDGRLSIDGRTHVAIQEYLEGFRHCDVGTAPYGMNSEVLTNQSSEAITVTNIELRQDDGQPIPQTGLRDGLAVRIAYTAHRTVLVPGFIVMLRSSDGVEICRVSNMPISGYYIPEIFGSGQIEVKFDKLPLTGGRYYISIGVARASVEWLLRLDDVAWFDMSARDAYGSGLALDTRRGYLIIPHQWKHLTSGVSIEVGKG